ncbi:hypothetical protein BC629DRAFT_1593097 [Irpex lacteus]|nr:hypothetical protein BC629DRAFT_1593097 [Irpex lacteus]
MRFAAVSAVALSLVAMVAAQTGCGTPCATISREWLYYYDGNCPDGSYCATTSSAGARVPGGDVTVDTGTCKQIDN